MTDETQLATADDLADSLRRPLSSDELLRADRRLMRAQEMLNERVSGDLSVRVALPADDPDRISPAVAAEVIAGIVARQWRNPNGVTSHNRGAGPFTRGESFRDQDRPGEMYVAQSDVDTLLGVTDDDYVAAGTFTVTPRWPFSGDPCSPE